MAETQRNCFIKCIDFKVRAESGKLGRPGLPEAPGPEMAETQRDCLIKCMDFKGRAESRKLGRQGVDLKAREEPYVITSQM